jgi:galactose mutarotase-like enzyme
MVSDRTSIEPAPSTGLGETRFMLKHKEHSVLLSSFGATIVELWLPDKNGKIEDCVLGFDNVVDYDRERGENPYFGCVVGRVGNRIRNGKVKFTGCELLNFRSSEVSFSIKMFQFTQN